MKIFKRKSKNKVKVNAGIEFLEGLSDAVNKRKSSEEYRKKFLQIVNKAEEFSSGKSKSNYNKLKETIKRAKLEDGIVKPNYNMNNCSSPQKTNKFKLWFKNFKLKMKESWEMVKESGREIQYWAIAEYKIFTKLSYALNRNKDEIKIRKLFKTNKTTFINQHGYYKGTRLFNDFSSSINNTVKFHKRMEKLGY